MLSAAMEEALNSQLNAEFYSSYLYLAMCAQQQANGLNGAANWLGVQAKEELTHAVKFYDYINQAGGRVLLAAIQAPQAEWPSPLATFEYVLNHERHVTSLINTLVIIAEGESDQVTRQFLQWFIDEQVEEEESAGNVVSMLSSAGSDVRMLGQVDAELSLRR